MKPSRSFAIRMLATFAKILCFTVVSIAFISGICGAQSEEELELLRMFYKEKDLFSTATHHPKPVSQIAENVTIVTAKEIEAMNAHSVAEVLNRVPGLFINFNQGVGTVGSTSLLRIQGSEDRHVLVLVDDVPWNFLNSGAAETNTIPVGIIERIEIIKGPASSSWGSALGGVIHIITKSAGDTTVPTGSVKVSRGGMDTREYGAQVSGRAGKLSYYLFGDRTDSDGPGGARDFENSSFFSKIAFAATDRLGFEFSLGSSEPRLGLGEYTTTDFRSEGDNRNVWGTALLNADFTRDLSLNLSLFRLAQKSTISNTALGLGSAGAAGDLFQESVFDEATTGGSAQLVWKQLRHTAVVGIEFRHGELDQTITSGDALQALGAPARLNTEPTVDNRAVYLNDTLTIGRLSVTPGIRFDHNSIWNDFVSPSLGLAYRLGRETILRGSVARGFTAPPLSWSSGGALFLDPNPTLKNEKAWSYQVGMETAALRYLWLKTTLFRHDVEDVFTRELFVGGPPGFNDLIVNKGSSRRQGFEFEAETVPLWHLTMRTGFAYVNLEPAAESGASDIYTHTIGATYDDPSVLKAQLFGHLIYWDAKEEPDAEYHDYIWDLNLEKEVYLWGKITADLFFSIHNIFNGAQFLVADNPNPDRWMEAGLKIKF